MYMKNPVVKSSFDVIIVLLLCGLAMGQTETFQPVEPEKIPDILNTIINRVHENFRRIHTWQAETEVSWHNVYKGDKAKDIFMRTDAIGEAPNSITEITQSKTTFSCDLDKGFFYTKNNRTTPRRYIDLDNGKELGTKSMPNWYRVAILKPDYSLESTPYRIKKGRVVQSMAVKEKVDKNCTSCEQTSVVDPRDLFDARSPVWLNYPHILERIGENGEFIVDDRYALKVEKRVLDGDVQYRVHQPAKTGPNGENIWLIKTFSSNAAYNMISAEITRVGGEPINKRTFEYQLIEGVYVPNKTTEEKFDFEDGSLKYLKTKVYKNILLNHSIPTETFTYDNLGFEDGDILVDKVNDKKYTYQNKQLIEVKKK
jgi:hypothetical protein